MYTFMIGIFSILCTDLVAHFLGLCFVVACGLIVQSFVSYRG